MKRYKYLLFSFLTLFVCATLQAKDNSVPFHLRLEKHTNKHLKIAVLVYDPETNKAVMDVIPGKEYEIRAGGYEVVIPGPGDPGGPIIRIAKSANSSINRREQVVNVETSIYGNVEEGYCLYVNGSRLGSSGLMVERSAPVQFSDGTTSFDLKKMVTFHVEKVNRLSIGMEDFSLGDGLNWSISAGRLINGDSAGMIDFTGGTFDESILDISSLELFDAYNSETTVTRDDSDDLKQIETLFTKVVFTNHGASTGYDISYYEKSSGSWVLTKTWKVRRYSVSGGAFGAYIDYTCGGKVLRRKLYINSNHTQWYVEYGQLNGITFTPLRKDTTTYASNTGTYTLNYYHKSGSSYVLDHTEKKQYTYIDAVTNGYYKLKMLQKLNGSTVAYQENYTYYNKTDTDNGNIIGSLKSFSNSIGQWAHYEYYDDGRGIKKAYTPKAQTGSSLPTSFSSTNSRITEYDRVDAKYSDFSGIVLGSKIYEGSNDYSSSTGTFKINYGTIGNPRYGIFTTTSYMDPSHTTSGVTTKNQVYSDLNTGTINRYFSNRSKYTESSNGSAKSFVYQRGTFNSTTRAFTFGSLGNDWHEVTLTGYKSARSGFTSNLINSYNSTSCDALYLIANKSTATEKIYNKGRLVCERVLLYTGSGFEEIGWKKYTYATGGNLTKKESSNGTTWEGTYTNGLLTRSKDEKGIVTDYTYDGLNRVIQTYQHSVTYNGETVPGAKIKTEYDSVGHVLKQIQVGSGENIVTSSTYDTAGYLISEVKTDGTRMSYKHTSSGGYDVETTTNQTLGTSVTKRYYADGSLYSVTGDVIPEYYQYGFDNGLPYTMKRIGVANSGRYQKIVKDYLGNVVKTIVPRFNGTGTLTSTNTYDPKTGRLTKSINPGMADTLYSYNSLGDLEFKGLDINNDGKLTEASTDVLVKYETNNVKDSTGWWVDQKTYGYGTMNSSAKTLLTQSRTRVSGFTSGVISETKKWGQGGSSKAPMTRQWSVLNRKEATVSTYAQAAGVYNKTISVNANGLDVYSKAANGVVSEVLYDSLGRVSKTTSAGTWQRFEYFSGTTVRNSDYGPYGGDEIRTALYTYSGGSGSACGRLVKQTDALGNTVRYAYNNLGQVTYQWGSKVNPESYVYNSFGEMTDMYSYRSGSTGDVSTWSSGSFTNSGHTQWTYDTYTGLPMTQTDAGEHVTTYGYDEYNRQKYIVQPRVMSSQNGSTTGHPYQWLVYNSAGQTTGENYRLTSSSNVLIPSFDTDAKVGYREDVSYNYDRLGRCIEMSQNDGWLIISNIYDENGNLSSIKSNLNDYFYYNNSYSYDSYRRPFQLEVKTNKLNSKEITNLVHREQVTYNSSTGQINAIKNTADWSSKFNYAYTWDSIHGGLSKITSGSFTRSYSYGDSRLLLTQVANKFGSTNLETDTVVHDALGRITSQTQTGALFDRYNGGAIHSVAERLDGSYGYDSCSQLTGWRTYTGTSGTNDLAGRNWQFNYDLSGNRAAGNQSGISNGYTANNLNQYTQRTHNGKHAVSGFADSSANVIINGSAPDSRQGDYFYDEGSAQTVSTTQAAMVKIIAAIPGGSSSGKDIVSALYKEYWKIKNTEYYVYDANGNLTEDAQWTYLYDAKNQLVSMVSKFPDSDGNNIKTWFVYDPFGRRIINNVIFSKGEGTTLELLLYDGWNVISEINIVELTLKRDYLYGVDPSGGAGSGALLSMTDHTGDTPVSYHYLHNSHGDVTGLVDANGNLAAEYEYSPYGKMIRREDHADTGNPFGYSGQYTDKETGLIYYGMRFYNPDTGRFINQDPIGLSGGHNLYAFVGNNPMNSWDVRGMAGTTLYSDINHGQYSYGAYMTTMISSLVNHAFPSIYSGLSGFAIDVLNETIEAAYFSDFTGMRHHQNGNDYYYIHGYMVPKREYEDVLNSPTGFDNYVASDLINKLLNKYGEDALANINQYLKNGGDLQNITEEDIVSDSSSETNQPERELLIRKSSSDPKVYDYISYGAKDVIDTIQSDESLLLALKKLYWNTYPERIEQYRSSGDPTKIRLADGIEKSITEEGLFIVKNTASGNLDTVTGPFEKAKSSIHLDTSLIPLGNELLYYVHTHPHNHPPSFDEDYPYFRSNPKNNAWSIVITKKWTYFISPDQAGKGYYKMLTHDFLYPKKKK